MVGIKLEPVLKEYSWGDTEFIADLYGLQSREKPVAEAWYGVHENGSSRIQVDQYEYLRDFLSENSEYLPEDSDEFPFMLKILSASEALSLQVHPSKNQVELGRKLGEQCFVDYNGKNELLFALKPSVVLFGFLPVKLIINNLSLMIPGNILRFFSCLFDGYLNDTEKIKKFFKKLYTLDSDERKDLLKEFYESIEKDFPPMVEIKGIFDRIKFPFNSYSDDVSVLAPLFMNIISLDVGKTLFINSGTLHSIIYGTMVELQDSSDNVFRCGLTQKEKNIEKVIEYTSCSPTFPFLHMDSYLKEGISGFHLKKFSKGDYSIEKNSIEMILCLDGNSIVMSSEGSVSLSKGECILMKRTFYNYVLSVHSGEVIVVYKRGEENENH